MCRHDQSTCISGNRKEGLSPVTLTTTILLGLLWIVTNVAGLGEELGKMVLHRGGSIRQAGVVAIIVFVRTSHWESQVSLMILQTQIYVLTPQHDRKGCRIIAPQLSHWLDKRHMLDPIVEMQLKYHRHTRWRAMRDLLVDEVYVC
jgi:hypothetical protein